MDIIDKIQGVIDSVKEGTNINYINKKVRIIQNVDEIRLWNSDIVDYGAVRSKCCNQRVNAYYLNHFGAPVLRCKKCDEKCEVKWQIEIPDLDVVLDIFREFNVPLEFWRRDDSGDIIYGGHLQSAVFSDALKKRFDTTTRNITDERGFRDIFKAFEYNPEQNPELHKSLKDPITGTIGIKYKIPFSKIDGEVGREFKVGNLPNSWIISWGRVN